MSVLFLSQMVVASALASSMPASPGQPDFNSLMTPQPIIRIAQTGGTSTGSSLAGTEWLLKTLAGKDVDPDIGSSLGFNDEGGVHGSGGCNRFRGGVTIDGNALKFGDLASTMMACEENASRQEHAFHTALGKTVAYRIDAGDLVLLDDKGEILGLLTPLK